MAKFKVGDRVRRVKASEWPWQFGEVGKEYTVQSTSHGHIVIIDDQPGAGEQYFELVQPALKIEAGKFYKTRDGRKVGPAVLEDHGYSQPWCVSDRYYCDDGHWYTDKVEHDNDLIVEWEEPAVAVAARNDNAVVVRGVPVVGDCVTQKSWYSGFYEVTRIDRENLWIKADGINDLRYDLKSDWIIRRATPTIPAIVCLIENGQPKPSSTPHVHSSTASAEAEAKRLASIHKGQEFGVYVLTATSKEAAPTYGHEWQRLAAKGEKIAAIKALRAATGMQLKPAKDVVEHFDRAPYGEIAA